MMRNEIQINTDGVCVFMLGKVKPNLVAKTGLVLTIIFFLAGIFLRTVSHNRYVSEVGFVFLILALLGGLCSRYLLWNSFGEEYVSFSTKSILCHYNFGLFRPAEKTMRHDGRLKFCFEIIHEDEMYKYGQMQFVAYDENDQPYEIFCTTVYMTENESQELIEKLQLIFELSPEKKVTVSLN
jgi:hypothetical protein